MSYLVRKAIVECHLHDLCILYEWRETAISEYEIA
jgi:hypothetical protein